MSSATAQVSSATAQGSPGCAAGEEKPSGLCCCSWPALVSVEEPAVAVGEAPLPELGFADVRLCFVSCRVLRSAPSSAVSAAELCPAASSALGVSGVL